MGNPDRRELKLISGTCLACVCSTLLIVVYDFYRPWYVPPDVFASDTEFWMAIVVVLGSLSNAREVVQLFEVIQAT